MSVSVLLADDHEIVRSGLRAYLERQTNFVVVGEASDGLEAIRQVERVRPDILLLDLMMPGLNGLETLRILRQRMPEVRVVVLSGYVNESFVAEALEHGALGYVLKGSNVEELLSALQAAAVGKSFLSSAIPEAALAAYRTMAASGRIDPHETLTPRERQVLQLAAEGHTCPQIARRLHISERTVENHRAHLMQKLGVRTQTDLVRYAIAHKIISADPPLSTTPRD